MSTYTLTEHGISQQRKRTLKLVIPLIVVGSFPVLFYEYSVHHDIVIILLTCIVAAVAASIGIRKGLMAQATIHFIIENNLVISRAEFQPDLIIHRHEIQRIIQTEEGALEIISIFPHLSINVPTTTNDFDRMKAELSSWMAIIPLPDSEIPRHSPPIILYYLIGIIVSLGTLGIIILSNKKGLIYIPTIMVVIPLIYHLLLKTRLLDFKDRKIFQTVTVIFGCLMLICALFVLTVWWFF